MSAEDCPLLVAILPVFRELPTPPAAVPQAPASAAGRRAGGAGGDRRSLRPLGVRARAARGAHQPARALRRGAWAEAAMALDKALAATRKRDAAIVVVGVLGTGMLAQAASTDPGRRCDPAPDGGPRRRLGRGLWDLEGTGNRAGRPSRRAPVEGRGGARAREAGQGSRRAAGVGRRGLLAAPAARRWRRAIGRPTLPSGSATGESWRSAGCGADRWCSASGPRVPSRASSNSGSCVRRSSHARRMRPTSSGSATERARSRSASSPGKSSFPSRSSRTPSGRSPAATASPPGRPRCRLAPTAGSRRPISGWSPVLALARRRGLPWCAMQSLRR